VSQSWILPQIYITHTKQASSQHPLLTYRHHIQHMRHVLQHWSDKWIQIPLAIDNHIDKQHQLELSQRRPEHNQEKVLQNWRVQLDVVAHDRRHLHRTIVLQRRIEILHTNNYKRNQIFFPFAPDPNSTHIQREASETNDQIVSELEQIHSSHGSVPILAGHWLPVGIQVPTGKVFERRIGRSVREHMGRDLVRVSDLHEHAAQPHGQTWSGHQALRSHKQ
jgi:hypothetical protein